jgi:hypothetical protein
MYAASSQVYKSPVFVTFKDMTGVRADKIGGVAGVSESFLSTNYDSLEIGLKLQRRLYTRGPPSLTWSACSRCKQVIDRSLWKE